MRACLTIALLLAASAALAQPQAPVTWGEARWIGLGYDLYNTEDAQFVVGGDTVLYFRMVDQPRTVNYAYSWNNEALHTEWTRMDADSYQVLDMWFCNSSNWIYAFFDGGNNYGLMRRSSNGGATWEATRSLNPYWGPGAPFAFGENLYCVAGYYDNQQQNYFPGFLSSTNRGTTWRLYQRFDAIIYGFYLFDACAITSRNMLFVAMSDSLDYYDCRLLVAQGSLDGTHWEHSRTLSDRHPVRHLNFVSMAADPTSETAMIFSGWQLLNGGPNDLWLTRTTDAGDTWQPPVAFVNAPQWYNYWDYPHLFHRGQLWAIAIAIYIESEQVEGLYLFLSANDGRNWYPRQLVAPEWMGFTIKGQFIGSQVRVYWELYDTTRDQVDFRSATGILTPDTVFPSVMAETLAPDSVNASDTILFRASATDNDTLAEVRVNIFDGTDTLRVPMLHDTGAFYSVRWSPNHEGNYHYWFSAEDFWENRASYPDSGQYQFYAQGLSVREHQLRPSQFGISVYPNPCNGWPNIRLSSDWFEHGPVTVSVFNVLGQKCYGGQFTSISQAEHCLKSTSKLIAVSGIYLLRVQGANRSATQKILLLR